MLLTSRNKPIYINPTQIVAISQCTPSETDTLGANCCIHCVGQSFLVKETFEQVYLKITGETILFSNVIVQPEEPETPLTPAQREHIRTTEHIKTTNRLPQGNPIQEAVYTQPLTRRARRSPQ